MKKSILLEKQKIMKDKLTRELTMAEARFEREQAKQEEWEKIKFELAEELEETRLEQEQIKNAELEKARLKREQATQEVMEEIKLELAEELEDTRLKQEQVKDAELENTSITALQKGSFQTLCSEVKE